MIEKLLELVLRNSEPQFVGSIDDKNDGLTLGIIVLPE